MAIFSYRHRYVRPVPQVARLARGHPPILVLPAAVGIIYQGALVWPVCHRVPIAPHHRYAPVVCRLITTLAIHVYRVRVTASYAPILLPALLAILATHYNLIYVSVVRRIVRFVTHRLTVRPATQIIRLWEGYV